jgi:hypothetical protein
MLLAICVTPSQRRSKRVSVSFSRYSSDFFPQTLLDAFSVSVFAAVDQGLSDAIAKAIGAPTARPLAVAPATEVVPLRTNIGQNTVSIA